MPGTRKLGRSSSHRMAMLRAMVTFLLENGKIETTVTRAKEVRALTEKMITTAKTNDLTPSVRYSLSLRKRTLRRSSLTRSPRSMPTPRAAIRGSSRLDLAAATQRKWRSSSLSELDVQGINERAHPLRMRPFPYGK